MISTMFAIGPGIAPLTLPNDARVVIVGGPRCGKSHLAQWMRRAGWPTFCGDPRSKVKFPEPGVTYLPEEYASPGRWSDGSRFVVDSWLPMIGPWVLEGHMMARVLRKWLGARYEIEDARPGLKMNPYPCDRVIVFPTNHPDTSPTVEQRAMHKGVMKQWSDVEEFYEPITTVVDWSD